MWIEQYLAIQIFRYLQPWEASFQAFSLIRNFRFLGEENWAFLRIALFSRHSSDSATNKYAVLFEIKHVGGKNPFAISSSLYANSFAPYEHLFHIIMIIIMIAHWYIMFYLHFYLARCCASSTYVSESMNPLIRTFHLLRQFGQSSEMNYFWYFTDLWPHSVLPNRIIVLGRSFFWLDFLCSVIIFLIWFRNECIYKAFRELPSNIKIEGPSSGQWDRWDDGQHQKYR